MTESIQNSPDRCAGKERGADPVRDSASAQVDALEGSAPREGSPAPEQGFELGTPVLVCRWRLAGGRLPLENRHLRAFAARGASMPLVSWAKQHIEWTLEDGATDNPDGVLMIVVDDQGQAAMSVGPYAPLTSTDATALAARATQAREEKPIVPTAEKDARATGYEPRIVAPETLWGARDGALCCALAEDATLSGAASLVADLAKARHVEVWWGTDPLEAGCDELFLVSDEHGVVPAADRAGETGALLAADYAHLLEKTRT